MKYLIVTLIKGKASQYQQKLLYSIAEQFHVKEAIKRKPPAHITLKYSFYTDDISPVEDCIKGFCLTHKSSSYKLKGISHFGDEVIFIDIIPSEQMKTSYSELITLLRSNTKIKFHRFDGSTHFHSSLAHTDIKPKFQEIFSSLPKETPDFTLSFDNITILKLVDGIWQVHKEFLLD